MSGVQSNAWELLEGEALTKASTLLHTEGFSSLILWARKFGRKTVFARDHGVWTLYAIHDDGRVVSEKSYRGQPSTAESWRVALLACGWSPERIADDFRVHEESTS